MMGDLALIWREWKDHQKKQKAINPAISGASTDETIISA